MGAGRLSRTLESLPAGIIFVGDRDSAGVLLGPAPHVSPPARFPRDRACSPQLPSLAGSGLRVRLPLCAERKGRCHSALTGGHSVWDSFDGARRASSLPGLCPRGAEAAVSQEERKNSHFRGAHPCQRETRETGEDHLSPRKQFLPRTPPNRGIQMGHRSQDIWERHVPGMFPSFRLGPVCWADGQTDARKHTDAGRRDCPHSVSSLSAVHRGSRCPAGSVGRQPRL